MQFNCLLFPSKKKINVDSIANKILLIPHEQFRSHIYYQNFINPALIVKDQLSQVIQPKKLTKQISIREQLRRLSEMKRKISGQPGLELLEESFEKLNQERRVSAVGSPMPPVEMKTLPMLNKQESLIKPFSSETEPSTKVRGYIPCLFLPGSEKFILYFHGNAEDIKSASEFLKYIHRATGNSVFAMQYEGYSIYEGSPSADKIEKDIIIVMNYLMRMGLPLENIFVIGRSIGSGPALSLVSQFKVAGIMLVSPFLSICKLVKDKYGTIASYLIKERFENYKIIELIQVPIFILHGTNDTIIPRSHSEILYEISKKKAELLLVDGMTHMAFDFRNDFLIPLEAFFARIKF